jgi:hypothetical protein
LTLAFRDLPLAALKRCPSLVRADPSPCVPSTSQFPAVQLTL